MARWLGVWMAVAVQLVSLGLHNGSTMVAERSAAQFFTARYKWVEAGVEEAYFFYCLKRLSRPQESGHCAHPHHVAALAVVD